MWPAAPCHLLDLTPSLKLSSGPHLWPPLIRRTLHTCSLPHFHMPALHVHAQETTDAWKKAEAETVRAEHAAQVSTSFYTCKPVLPLGVMPAPSLRCEQA